MRPAIIALVCSLASCAAADDAFDLGATNVLPAIVLRVSDTPVVQNARRHLSDYLESLTRAHSADSVSAVIVLGDASLAKEYGMTPPDPTRDESFSIAPVKRQLVILGQTDKGVKQGIYSVLRHLRVSDGRLLVDQPTAQSSPFIKLRVSHVGGAMSQPFDRTTGARLPKALPPTTQQLDWNHIDRWGPERVGDYADLLDFLGYNGIEEPPAFYAPESADAQSPARRKILRDHVVANGMISIAKIDGTLFDQNERAIPYGNDTKARYDAYYRAMAESAAPYNDIVLTHWVDAGGWKSSDDHPCTIELLQDLHMRIDAEFKRVNPKIRSVLSLWNLANPNYQRWLGYKGVETILSSGKIPADVGIALHKTYNANDAKKILAAGHPVSVWGWYLADQELVYTMHVHTHLLGDYFHKLPDDARDAIDFHVLDNNQRETNLYSIYVGAQLMWNPHADPDALLREIARVVYGPKLEEPVFRALKAIADVRCGDGQCRGYWTAANTLMSRDGASREAIDAWNGLRDIEIDASYVPPIRFHRPTNVLLAELKGQVRAVATYMQYLNNRATEVPASSGPFEYYERFQYLRDHQKSTSAPAGSRP